MRTTQQQEPTFTPGPWLSRRWAAKRALEEQSRLARERQERRQRQFPERHAHGSNEGLRAWRRQNVARWLNWAVGFLFALLFLSHLAH